MKNKHTYSDDDFLHAIKNSFSIRGALTKLGLAASGGSYKIFNLRAEKLNADRSHFTGAGHLKGKTHNWSKKLALDELLIKNSGRPIYSKQKTRLIKEGLLINSCYKCGLKDSWNNEPLVLQIDHINGDHFDHRIENLRMLCPNCHSQTPTFCSKNKGIRKVRKSNYLKAPKIKEVKICPVCNTNNLSDIRCDSCLECYNSKRKQLRKEHGQKMKIVWPSVEELKIRLETIPYITLAKELGVSDNAIRKHIKNNGLVG